MSTYYRTEVPIKMDDLFDGRLEAYGVTEVVGRDTTRDRRCLIDGRNCLWAYVEVDRESGVRYLGDLQSTGLGNAPGRILGAIRKAFDTRIYSEDEPQFWGFATEAEWDAFQVEIRREHDDAFYADIVKYISGEPNDIKPGTIGARQAAIAARLVKEKPEILGQKEKLLSEIEEIDMRDHAVVVTLTPEDVATATMLATHEDDLPRA